MSKCWDYRGSAAPVSEWRGVLLKLKSLSSEKCHLSQSSSHVRGIEVAKKPADHVRNSTVGVSPSLTPPCWNETASCKHSTNAAFPHLHMLSGDGWSSLSDRKSLSRLAEDENHPVDDVFAMIALEEIHDEAPFPVIVLGPTGAQMCKLSYEL